VSRLLRHADLTKMGRVGSSAKLGLNKDFLAPCPGDCITLVTAASFWPERKKNLGLEFELVWRQFYIGNSVLAPNEFKFEPEIFLSGQKLAAVTKGIQSPAPWTWLKKILVQPQFGGVTTFYSWRRRRLFFRLGEVPAGTSQLTRLRDSPRRHQQMKSPRKL
jgi:hypothetical protein